MITEDIYNENHHTKTASVVSVLPILSSQLFYLSFKESLPDALFWIFFSYLYDADIGFISQFNLFTVSHVCSCWRFKWLNECQTNQETYIAM